VSSSESGWNRCLALFEGERFPARRRRELWDAYALFVAAYQTAAEKLRAGIRDVKFPRGSFPPALPYVSGG
jgi:hypothetical protein